ncbi:MAG: ABC transporter ATP-binding protein [Elusimicrobia bacterium]|nr:ABC transporter ATP-binding protein [Elusimicrobiota bacterium]
MILQLANVTKSFKIGDRTMQIVRGVDMVIEKGEFVSIMGPSGSGKSTLLYMLGLLDEPTTGKVLSNGKVLSELPDAESARFRNRMMGFVFQSYRLLPQYSALGNVCLPLAYAGEMHRREDAKKLLDRMGLGKRINNRPSELSGGECQRVAICRSLVNHPPILLGDEPTGALDTKTGEEIMNIFLELHREGMTVCLVTHDPRIAKKTQRIYHFSDGKVQG